MIKKHKKKGKVNCKNEYKIINANKNKVKENYSSNKFNFIDNKDLSFSEYYEKDVLPDGNCYYRVLSYYYRETEEFHKEFRELIYNLYINNKHMFLESVPDYEYIGLPKPKNDEDIENLLNEYGKYINTPNSYAGDIEIALTSLYFCVNINITILDNFVYKNYLYYKSNVETEENINILYVNGF
jgi:hypothetical protein